MNDNYSKAAKARWAKVSAEKRSAMGRHAALARWAKATKKMRKAQSVLMTNAKDLHKKKLVI